MKTIDLSLYKNQKYINLGRKYRHIFQCPRCKIVNCFDGYGKIPKDSTFEASCDCGIGVHEYVRSRVLK